MRAAVDTAAAVLSGMSFGLAAAAVTSFGVWAVAAEQMTPRFAAGLATVASMLGLAAGFRLLGTRRRARFLGVLGRYADRQIAARGGAIVTYEAVVSCDLPLQIAPTARVTGAPPYSPTAASRPNRWKATR